MKIQMNAEELINHWMVRRSRAAPVAEQVALQMGHIDGADKIIVKAEEMIGRCPQD